MHPERVLPQNCCHMH